MKRLLLSTAASIPLIVASAAYAQTTSTPAPAEPAPYTAPRAMPMESPAPMTSSDASKKEILRGWSVKDKVMGKNVYNENDDKIGEITDIILGAGGTAAYAIVGAGGFLGMGQHDVAIPFDKVQMKGDKFVLLGYTKDQLKDLPQVELN